MRFEISEVFAFDDDFFKSFEGLANRFMPIMTKAKYLGTWVTLVGLMGSVNSIKLGIYDLAKVSDTHLYEIKILHRALIEHYLKFYYALFRFLDEKSDNVGLEYRKFSRISETLAYINASNFSNAMIGKTTEDQALEQLKKKYPDSKISKKQLNDIVSKWNYRNIIRYLKTNVGLIGDEGSYLLKLIPEYAKLSSFVHGGMFACDYYHEVFDSKELKKLVYCEVAEVCFIAAVTKVHLMLAVIETDKSFSDGMLVLANKVSKFVDNVDNHLFYIGSIKEHVK